jgi:lipid-binding SYLF domain-containing protein
LLTPVLLCAAGAALALVVVSVLVTFAANGVDEDVEATLQKLYATTPAAKRVGGQAKTILVFPKIVKAGFLVGGQYGSGALDAGHGSASDRTREHMPEKLPSRHRRSDGLLWHGWTPFHCA